MSTPRTSAEQSELGRFDLLDANGHLVRAGLRGFRRRPDESIFLGNDVSHRTAQNSADFGVADRFRSKSSSSDSADRIAASR